MCPSVSIGEQRQKALAGSGACCAQQRDETDDVGAWGISYRHGHHEHRASEYRRFLRAAGSWIWATPLRQRRLHQQKRHRGIAAHTCGGLARRQAGAEERSILESSAGADAGAGSSRCAFSSRPPSRNTPATEDPWQKAMGEALAQKARTLLAPERNRGSADTRNSSGEGWIR